jgi:hypothetical protein
MPFVAPIVVPWFGLSAGETAAGIGGLVVASEVAILICIPLVSKEGFRRIKQRHFGWLKLPKKPTSYGVHVIGVSLLIGGLLIDALLNMSVVSASLTMSDAKNPNMILFGMDFADQISSFLVIEIGSTVAVVVGIFILGADFWERIRQTFQWQPE